MVHVGRVSVMLGKLCLREAVVLVLVLLLRHGWRSSGRRRGWARCDRSRRHDGCVFDLLRSVVCVVMMMMMMMMRLHRFLGVVVSRLGSH